MIQLDTNNQNREIMICMKLFILRYIIVQFIIRKPWMFLLYSCYILAGNNQ